MDPDLLWEGTWLGEGVGMDHGKGAGTTEPAPVGPAGDSDVGPIKPGGTKNPFDLSRNTAGHLYVAPPQPAQG